ncbi:MAG: HetZ-related protein 2, partial [Synechococcaceae cyanobacterium RL_1_2]|nr:HetZ-related protein 2 [Synechococcaceae cyanobacterium RL_1_2]
MTVVEEITQTWQTRLAEDQDANFSEAQRRIIIGWLLGENAAELEQLDPRERQIMERAHDYRYRVFRQRYFQVSQNVAYSTLIKRFVFCVCSPSKNSYLGFPEPRSRRAITDVIEEVIQEMIQKDKYIQQQIQWIGQLTPNQTFRSTLLLATIEEYCLRPIRNQPLLAYRFVNFLRRSQRGGMTKVPQAQMLKFISENIAPEGEDQGEISLLDDHAIVNFESEQDWVEQQAIREEVQEEFKIYLGENIGEEAVQWLELYLFGKTQEEISQEMGLPIKKIYRLREKINYHAVKIFAIKAKPEITTQWLKLSLSEHNLGLNQEQWEEFIRQLSDEQEQLVALFREGRTTQEIANFYNWKPKKVVGEWGKIYLI